MKVLLIVDVWGWAFEFVARGIKEYSKHECIIKRWNEVDQSVLGCDCIFCLNDSVWNAMGNKSQSYISKIPKKCVGIRGEEMPSDRILNGWTIGAVNEKIYNNLMEKIDTLPVKGVYLTRNGVDTNIFKPVDRTDDRLFVVGWAGNPTQHLKRFYLLQQIQFPMKVVANWGRQFFVKDRSRSEMLSFYSNIDAFINVSIHEGMPQSVLEAAATKLPIVVTNAGGMAEFVDPEWVVESSPENLAVFEMNEKLELLRDNVKLRKQVGERNLQKILREWTWAKRVKEYDKMFEEA